MSAAVRRTADEVRGIPLRELLRWHGFEIRQEGVSYRARSDHHNIVITGNKWFDNKAGAGGAGAIDLQMHLCGGDFQTTCLVLAEGFRPTGAGLVFPQGKGQENRRRSFEELAAQYAVPSTANWPVARDYLIETRKIETGIVDELHERGSIYSNNHRPNPGIVFLPEDNKLRLYSVTRLDAETYAQVKAAGFSWAPRQQLFVAPTWTPQREDLLFKLCGEIGDEDKLLVQRAGERAERFENYSENRSRDAEQARKQVDSIVEHIPFGQPILVGHHSERRARKDAERIDSGMRKSIKMWDTSKYWTARAEAAIDAAKYKERPDVRARRIKKIEAELRKKERTKVDSERLLKTWSKLGLTMEEAAKIANVDHGYFLSASARTDGKTWPVSLWDVTQGRYEPQPKVEEITAKAIQNHQTIITWADRWLGHFSNRLAYERTMLVQAGGIAADKNTPQIGGACKCWASPRGGWSLIQKINKVSVTVLDNWGNGGSDFTRTIPFDKLNAVMSRAEVEAARQAGLILGEQPIGFILASKPSQIESVSEAVKHPPGGCAHGPLSLLSRGSFAGQARSRGKFPFPKTQLPTSIKHMARHQKPGTIRFDLDISAEAQSRFASIHKALGFKTKTESFEAIVFTVSIKDVVDPNAIGRIETKLGHVLEVLESVA